MPDTPPAAGHHKKLDKKQVIIVVGTVALVIIGILTLKKGSGNGGGGGSTPGTAAPSADGAAPATGSGTENAADQSRWDSVNGKLVDLQTQLAKLKLIPAPTTPTGGVPAVHPTGNGSHGTHPPVTSGKRKPTIAHPGAASGAATHYDVKQGDTLSAIARHFGTSWQALYAANKPEIDAQAKEHGHQGHFQDWIFPKEQLKIPGQGPAPANASRPHPSTPQAAHPVAPAKPRTQPTPTVHQVR